MADLPISGLPAITVVSDSYLLAAVSESVTAQMTVKQVGDAYSSSLSLFPYTGSAQITGSLGVTGSVSISGSSSIVGGFNIRNFTAFGNPASVQIRTYAADATTDGAWYSWGREFLQMGPINSGTDATFTMAFIPADNYTGVTPVDRPSLYFNTSSQIYLNDTDFRIYSPSVRTFKVERMNTVLSGSLNVSGSIFVGGNIIPLVSKSFSLGSADFPFKDIFISSGSLVIASDDPNAPSTTLSNVDGNILISAGGMQLVGSGSFNATTGSFSYISGSMTQLGNYTQFGNYVMQGNKTITGSLNIKGSYNLSTSYIDGNTVGATVDLTKQVLVMSDGTWILPDGVEGQIIYFTLDNGGSAEDSYLTVNHLRYNNNGLGTQVINGSWSPFQYSSGQPDFAVCTAIFTDGYWAFSGGRLR